MKRATYFGVVCILAIASVGITVADDNANGVYRDSDVRFKYARLATVAIPCIQDGLRFSCSNKSSRRSLEVVDVKCIVGAGVNPDVTPVGFPSEVAPETTEVVEPVLCPMNPHPCSVLRACIRARMQGVP